MKRMNILSTALGMMIVALSACTDLDETLYSQLAKSNYYVDQQSVEAAVLRAHEHGDNVTWRGSIMLLEELTADQFVWTQKGRHGYDDGQWDRLHRHTWNYIQGDVNGAWEGAFQGLSQANVVLRDFNNVDFKAIGVSEAQEKGYKAELRVLRAWYYIFLLNDFRHVPIATERTGETELVPQATGKEVFDFIESELKAAIPDLPKEKRLSRWTQGPAAGLLVRLYLNAKTWIGEDRYADCKRVCEDILGGVYGAYHLDPDYRGPFSSGIDGYESPENLFEFKHQYGQLQQYTWWNHASHYAANKYIGASGGGWNGILLQPSRDLQGNVYHFESGLGTPYENYAESDYRRQPFRVHAPDAKGFRYDGYFIKGLMRSVNGSGDGYIDYRKDDLNSASNVNGQEEWSGSPLVFVDQVGRFSEDPAVKAMSQAQRADLLMEVADRGCFITHAPEVTGKGEDHPEDKGSNVFLGEENSGIRLNKFPYLPEVTGQFRSQCTPEIRLAEIYYSLAECYYREGNIAKAAALLDAVRKRNFPESDWVNQSYAQHSERLTDIEFIKEWGREFIGERRRRTDLVRWGMFGKAWWAKQDDANLTDGKERTYFPIPQRQLNANPELKQTTPGWEN
ncbi:RagB/SusD family nutrient uptake outer membrane protein [Phocaeicola abscessus]|uniref:RagB/SusD family nutrient uptake outer membrane protein n=1 Tax=Phocaeicola abscessus TaxID=555313 RepID=UPI0004B41D97|nr:RagB/SusD family nutrient uptake outer membrane protein [Phocaeicola abscessus]